MSDIVFRNISYALFAEVKHGQIRLKGKLDSGAPINVFNLSAVSLFLGTDESKIKESILRGGTPKATFKGYNGLSSTIHLCVLYNVIIDQYHFSKFYAGVSLDYPIDRDGRPVTKILLGMDLINCCEGTLARDGSMSLSVKKPEQQKIRMLDAFSTKDDTGVFVIDDVTDDLRP